MIIDFHTHTFPARIAGRAIAGMEKAARMKAYLDGTPEALISSMERAGVDLSVSLPVATHPGQPHKLNLAAIEANKKGGPILYFGAAHPEDPNWKEELRFAAYHGLKGIKLHPMYQAVNFDDIRTLRLVGTAAELGLIVVVHAGEDIGIPGKARCTPENALYVQQKTGIDTLVLAHMGGWMLWERVLKVLVGAPIYLDTSFSFGKANPHPEYIRRDDELQLGDSDLLKQILLNHPKKCLLFGSDSPWGEPAIDLAILKGLNLEEDRLSLLLGETPVDCSSKNENSPVAKDDLGAFLMMEGAIMRETAIIFDLDGTLLNTLEDISDSVNASLRHFGYPERSTEEVRRFVGNGARRLIAQSLPFDTSEQDINRVLFWYDAWYGSHSRIKTAPYPGIPELLEELYRRGISCAVVSNKQDPIVKDLTARFFGKWISVAIGERKGIRRKPAPDSVLAAIEALSSTSETSIYVGDSETDLLTAQNAGIPCLSVTWGFRDRKELQKAGAMRFADHPLELLRFL